MENEVTGCFTGLAKWRRRPDTNPNIKIRNNSTRAVENPLPGCTYHDSCCNFSISKKAEKYLGRRVEEPPAYTTAAMMLEPEVIETIEKTIDGLDHQLRELSLELHGHPETAFQEKLAHDTLSAFMEMQGFVVTRHYLSLETAWRAEFVAGKGGRVIGVNSEMDSLPGIGHACGHNLIAIAGVGVAIGIKAALQAHGISGTVVLLGTPAEEAGGGKIILLERGGYKDMDVCMMCHPSTGDSDAEFPSSLAMQDINVEYFGRAAHAALAPWEGQNALDAAFLAYSGVSVLRQQLKPDCRVHGIVEGKNWAPNIIPDYAKLRWIVRAPTWAEVVELRNRVTACLEAAAHATSCRTSIDVDTAGYFDLRQNDVLAQNFANVLDCRYGLSTNPTGIAKASTDFGNVSYELPSIHPVFAIPSPGGGNHSVAFTDAARTVEAHRACIAVTKGLAITGLRVLDDDEFFNQVKNAFERSRGVETRKR